MCVSYLAQFFIFAAFVHSSISPHARKMSTGKIMPVDGGGDTNLHDSSLTCRDDDGKKSRSASETESLVNNVCTNCLLSSLFVLYCNIKLKIIRRC